MDTFEPVQRMPYPPSRRHGGQAPGALCSSAVLSLRLDHDPRAPPVTRLPSAKVHLIGDRRAHDACNLNSRSGWGGQTSHNENNFPASEGALPSTWPLRELRISTFEVLLKGTNQRPPQENAQSACFKRSARRRGRVRHGGEAVEATNTCASGRTHQQTWAASAASKS